MPADPTTAEPATAQPAKDLAPRAAERGLVLGLVRKLIAHGQALIATLQGRNSDTPPVDIARNLGSLNITLIIARITRGLMLAAALETRLLRPLPPTPAKPVAPAKPCAKPRARRSPPKPQPDEEAELRAALPSAREIAERIRKRPVGAVIVEICRDLGIDGLHPLWGEVLNAIRFHRGNLWRLMQIIQARGEWVWRQNLPLPELPDYARPVAAGLHPP